MHIEGGNVSQLASALEMPSFSIDRHHMRRERPRSKPLISSSSTTPQQRTMISRIILAILLLHCKRIRALEDGSCVAVGTQQAPEFDLELFVWKTWYVQYQQITSLQPQETLHCATQTFNLGGIQYWSDAIWTDFYSNRYEVNGPVVGTERNYCSYQPWPDQNPAKVSRQEAADNEESVFQVYIYASFCVLNLVSFFVPVQYGSLLATTSLCSSLVGGVHNQKLCLGDSRGRSTDGFGSVCPRTLSKTVHDARAELLLGRELVGPQRGSVVCNAQALSRYRHH